MPEPLYRQIAEDLRCKIESGELAPGSQLMTEIELREHYEASRNTVRDAVRMLITRGLVETRPGQGTFVARRIDPFVTKLSGDPACGGSSEIDVYVRQITSPERKHTVTEPRVEIQRATSDLASQLEVSEGQPVLSRHQRHMIDGTPWSLQTSFYPMSFVNDGAFDLIETLSLPKGDVQYLRETIGINQVGWRDFVLARVPDRYETFFFGLPDDGQVPVFEIRRTSFDDTGRSIRLTITVYPADRNMFTYEEGLVPVSDTGRPSIEPGDSEAVARESRDRTMARRPDDFHPYPASESPR
jgi:GntR family transcriptional regulator